MKSVLMIVNTYYQLIVALQLKNTLFADEKVVVLLSNHSRNMDQVSKKLKEYRVFEQIFYIESKNIVIDRNSIDKIVDFFQITFGNKNRYSLYLRELDNLYYDELICFNYGMDIFGVYSILSKYNDNLKVSLFEEGILSYRLAPLETKKRKLINLIRKALKKRAIEDALTNFYCFHPKLYDGELNPVMIPNIEFDGKTAEELRIIFNLHNVKEYYEEKYIFFTSVYDFEGGEPIGEYELVCKIADLVGSDNILIKTHPRDSRNIYENSFKVDKLSSIPWEAIQLSGDFSDKVFLTATSGSVLAGSFISKDPVKTYYLYKLCNIQNNGSAQKSAQDINNLLTNYTLKELLKRVSIVDDLKEIIEDNETKK